MTGALLDQGLPRSAARLLRDSGLHAIHVGELGMSAATDVHILEHARENDLVVVTLDADFHAILAVTNATSPSVIRIRQQRLKADETATIVRSVFASWSDSLNAGAVVSVSGGLVRLKRLPIRAKA